MTKIRVRLIAAALTALALLPAGSAVASRIDPPGQREVNRCLTLSGVDLNVLFGVSDQFVTRFCTEVSAGEHWRPFGFWIVNSVNETFPPGYVPSAPTPIEDFAAKLVVVKIIIDGGTAQERIQVFAPSEVLRSDVSADQLEPGFPQLPMAVTLPRLGPPRVGQHTRELRWVLSAQHCDGLGVSVEDNCIPAGESSFGVAPFTVATPATESDGTQ